jgi:hypothetical protein
MVTVLIAIYLFLVFLLPLALSAMVGYRALPTGCGCPQCRGETLRLQSRSLQYASAVLPRTEVHRRWCMTCGWDGVVKVKPEPPLRVTPVPPVRPPRPSTRTLDVRALHIDGKAWRVLLQCWREQGRWLGRIVFVAPTGRLWTDSRHPFSGRTQEDVLGQALSLPDRALASRLRELVSD